jgi:hypothetical protein
MSCIARHRIGDGLGNAFVGHVQHVGARQTREHDPAEMLGGTGAGRTIPEFPGDFFASWTAFAYRLYWHLWVDHLNKRHRADQADETKSLSRLNLR